MRAAEYVDLVVDNRRGKIVPGRRHRARVVHAFAPAPKPEHVVAGGAISLREPHPIAPRWHIRSGWLRPSRSDRLWDHRPNGPGDRDAHRPSGPMGLGVHPDCRPAGPPRRVLPAVPTGHLVRAVRGPSLRPVPAAPCPIGPTAPGGPATPCRPRGSLTQEIAVSLKRHRRTAESMISNLAPARS